MNPMIQNGSWLTAKRLCAHTRSYQFGTCDDGAITGATWPHHRDNLGSWQDKYFHFQPPQCFNGVVSCLPWTNSSGWITQQLILIRVRVNITVQTRVLRLAVNTSNIVNAVLEINTGSPSKVSAPLRKVNIGIVFKTLESTCCDKLFL